MTFDEYFGRWSKVIDKVELYKILAILHRIKNNICPEYNNIFRAFNLCKYDDCKVVFIGQDPYPQRGVATGILFGNNKTNNENLSPSLEVIKECVINFEIPHKIITFDNSLESWAKQGILMLNSALTCEVNKVGSHTNLWRPFITKLIKNLSCETGLIYVLFGYNAKTLKPYIDENYNDIIEVEHPAYYARLNKTMPYNVFTDINKLLKNRYNTTIKWYNEY